MANNICYYFGSFNPITSGHMTVAREAIRQFGFNRVIFVPVSQAPHKDSKHFAPFADRFEMLYQACKQDPHFAVSDIESRLSPPSYTIQTLRHLMPTFDQNSSRIPFIIGADALNALPAWKEARALARKLAFILAPRDSQTVPASMMLDRESVPLDIHRIPMQDMRISSTQVRKAAAQGQPLKNLVPAPVLEYITKKGLYGFPVNGFRAMWNRFLVPFNRLRVWLHRRWERVRILLDRLNQRGCDNISGKEII
ncbi:MAG TPA: nicotinate (nicotinamide) nucleotide adenylyltransferase [Coleofasciculaceae cyanobacterium]|jgi:nicotinate-nucleotide adenylyltransferase